eukprot:TRINITY_DN40522_c0_g1_i1.p1 TRINITY_DN40522_c0_g1~~TRINITY_DN40522_c0_g1_i1.p1  ORF type:complete len:181 (-),score=29.63 TRINITY_DN40522_c0_g1_i1:684-1226(-)
MGCGAVSGSKYQALADDESVSLSGIGDDPKPTQTYGPGISGGCCAGSVVLDERSNNSPFGKKTTSARYRAEVSVAGTEVVEDVQTKHTTDFEMERAILAANDANLLKKYVDQHGSKRKFNNKTIFAPANAPMSAEPFSRKDGADAFDFEELAVPGQMVGSLRLHTGPTSLAGARKLAWLP